MATEYDIRDDAIVTEVLSNPVAQQINHQKLATKIKDRSSVSEMKMRGLLYDHPSISPGLVDAHKLLQKRRASIKVDNMLKNRPDRDELRRKNILMQTEETEQTKTEHKRSVSRRLSQKLMDRPPLEALADIIFDAGLKANPEWDEDTLTTTVIFTDTGMEVEYNTNPRLSEDVEEELAILKDEIEDLKGQIRDLEDINLEQRDHMIELRDRSRTHTTAPDISSDHGGSTPRTGRRDSMNLDELQDRVDQLTEENFFLKQRLDKALETAERAQAENEKHFEKIQEMTQTITKLMTTRMSFQAQDVTDDRQRKASLAELMNSSQLTEIAQAQASGNPADLPSINEKTRASGGSLGSADRISELESVPENLQAMIALEEKCKELQQLYVDSQRKMKELRNQSSGGQNLNEMIDLIYQQPESWSLFDPNESHPQTFELQRRKVFQVLRRVFEIFASQQSKIRSLEEQIEHDHRDQIWKEEEAAREVRNSKHKHKASMNESDLNPVLYESVEAAIAVLESPEKRRILELEQEIKILQRSKLHLVNSTSIEMERMRSRLNALTFQLRQLV